MKEIICTAEEEGLTAMQLLQARIPAAPTGYLRQLLRAGKVRRDGLPMAPGTAVGSGDRVLLPESARLAELQAVGAVEILFESREVLVAYKPAGLAVHRGVGHEDNLTDRLREVMRRRQEPFLLAPAHRLDAETSGPVVFGKGRRATAALGRLFMANAVEKEYQALVSGHLPAAGRLNSLVPAKGKLKPSLTDWECLERRQGFSLLRLRLHSGRTHQIRRQLADAGHPIAGDRRYGGAALPGLDRLYLHASRLALENPFDGQRLEIAVPLPPELAHLLRHPADSGGLP